MEMHRRGQSTFCRINQAPTAARFVVKTRGRGLSALPGSNSRR
jgi:hypothetical protein